MKSEQRGKYRPIYRSTGRPVFSTYRGLGQPRHRQLALVASAFEAVFSTKLSNKTGRYRNALAIDGQLAADLG